MDLTNHASTGDLLAQVLDQTSIFLEIQGWENGIHRNGMDWMISDERVCFVYPKEQLMNHRRRIERVMLRVILLRL